MKKIPNKIAGAVVLLAALLQMASAQTLTSDKGFKGKIGRTAAESQEYFPEKKKAPAGAPNVIVFLIDDAGYGTSSAFGGLMQTPVLDSLANNGLRYTNFHSTGVCSPTRAALLTGRNHHSVHMGTLNYSSSGFPGYDAIMPADKGTIAEVLHENNYSTFAVGKYHVAPINEITAIGPYDRWAVGRGFDHFYGFQLGHTDQYHPNLYEDTKVVDVEPNGKHLTTLLADKAINYISNQKSVAHDKPFFLYFATGAIHSPHQVDKKWSDLYKGKFDKGWDWYREEVFARQKRLGVIPANAVLPDRDPTVKAWNSLSPEQKKVYARFMEIYAGFLTHADYEFGRIVNYLKEIGEADNTVILVSIGDNGSSHSPEHGSLNGYISSLDEDKQVAELYKNIDKLGTEHSFQDAPSGWTQATNTPFRLWKADPNSEGGTHQPLIVYYPNGGLKKGDIRGQYGHVIDIAPTIYELTGAKVPETIKGYVQKPLEGTSLVYSFKDAKAENRHKIQYYELFGKRAIVKDGWKASVFHKSGSDFNQDVWELYNLNDDFNERINLAAKYPEKVKELQALFDQEAIKYNVFPLNDNALGHSVGGRARSPFGLDKKVVLYAGIEQFLTLTGPQFQNDPFSITADVNIKSASDEGVLFATGSEFEGLSLFIKNGKFVVAHNTGSIVKYLESDTAVPVGKSKLKFEFNFTPPAHESKDKNAPAGTEAIYINDKKVGERNVVAAEGRIAIYKDGIDVGADRNSPVTDRYKAPFNFTGKLNNVTIEYK
ncbi:arylsulfatase [Pedobacter sp. HDW13]|uniref:arylsulfatase n=1 Tax=Pedobacter sp. HDW13 TaxID=2714940 RepID=UPI0014072C41|nr:arylsulfatase [Pedobacter sp. HDW13]QIL38005.1 arylsulfatase [Pedobacter sp. HDW13]